MNESKFEKPKNEDPRRRRLAVAIIDLTWLVTQSSAAMHIGGIDYEALSCASGGDATGMVVPDDAMRAVRRYRELDAPFRKLTPAHRGVIVATLEPRRVDPEVRDFFRDGAVVVQHMPETRAAYQRQAGDTKKPISFELWLIGVAKRKDAQARKLREKAEDKFLDAVQAFQDMRRGVEEDHDEAEVKTYMADIQETA